jgi:DNA-binding Xre family transcriptional regulator
MLNTPQQSTVIYDRVNRNPLVKSFKPGNKPSYHFGNEVLNGNIPWLSVLKNIMASRKFTVESLSQHLQIDPLALKKISNENDSSLINFKTGSRLLAIHDRVCHS